MKIVFILAHLHTQDDGEEDWKRIGIYSSRTKPMEALERIALLQGFSEYRDLIDHSISGSKNGFNIDEMELDTDGWETGFVTIT